MRGYAMWSRKDGTERGGYGGKLWGEMMRGRGRRCGGRGRGRVGGGGVGRKLMGVGESGMIVLRLIGLGMFVSLFLNPGCGINLVHAASREEAG